MSFYSERSLRELTVTGVHYLRAAPERVTRFPQTKRVSPGSETTVNRHAGGRRGANVSRINGRWRRGFLRFSWSLEPKWTSGLNPSVSSKKPQRHSPNVETTRKCRCVGARGQVAGVLPGPGELLPAEDGEAPEQSVPGPPAEQTDRLHLLRPRDERAALRSVLLVYTENVHSCRRLWSSVIDLMWSIIIDEAAFGPGFTDHGRDSWCSRGFPD